MRLSSVPPGVPFLDTLAARWLSGPADPERGLILLPTRRAARALAEAFLRQSAGAPMLLPRIVGLQRARELIMLGERFDAAQAHAWGLIHKVVPDSELMPEALALARRIAALPPGPVRDLRRILARRSGLEAAMEAETDATVHGFLDPATSTRVGAFR